MKSTNIEYMINEAKYKLYYSFISTLFCFCVCFFYKDVFLFYHLKLCQTGFGNAKIPFVTFHVTETFYAMATLGIYMSFIAVLPFWLYCIHTFLRPSKFQKEAFVQCVYFCMIAFLCYSSYSITVYTLLPTILEFFIALDTLQTWQHVPRVLDYIFFIVSLNASMHLLSQLPLLSVYCFSLFSFKSLDLTHTRKYWHVCLLCISAFISPPDVGLQLTCSFCLICLFECVYACLFIANMYKKTFSENC
jgi:sec-independent protein translocase protein TatC